MCELVYRKSNRLLTPSTVQNVFDSVDCKQGGKYFTFLSRSNTVNDTRLGIIIAKRNIKTAVQRNRIKRRIRETFRHTLPELHTLTHSFDVIVIVKSNAELLANSELTNELSHQWSKLVKKRLTMAA